MFIGAKYFYWPEKHSSFQSGELQSTQVSQFLAIHWNNTKLSKFRFSVKQSSLFFHNISYGVIEFNTIASGAYTIKAYDNNLDWLSIFASKPTSLLHSQLKHLRFLSLLIRLSAYQTQASLLGIIIIYVNNFHFNLVVMSVCVTFVSSVINLIYSQKLILL